MKFYNTAGPVRNDDHYCIDPLKRINLDEILMLIEQKKYFAIHAPRQSGKTSVLIALAEYLKKQGTYHALYFNIESVFMAHENMVENMKAILFELASRARDFLNDSYPESIVLKVLDDKGPNLAFNELLTLWTKNARKPIVLLIDEIDSLEGNLLISILRQLRSGYDKRPHLFPQSIMLCGVQNLQYKRIIDPVQGPITGGNVFNIEAKSLPLRNLTLEDIKELFIQYSKDSGIKLNQNIFERIWVLTHGQPWLVNALAYEICFEMIPRKNDIQMIRLQEVDEAAENLIQRKEMHLSNLVVRLQEERVKKVISSMLNGDELPKTLSDEDIRYLCDLGIVNVDDNKIQIANEIYNEVIPRSLIYSTQLLIRYNLSLFLEEDGRINIQKMIKGFQVLFNNHFDRWVEHFSYAEAGQPLLLQAFLQRIIDGGGKIERRYGLGRKHITLIIRWPAGGGIQTEVLDIRFIKDAVKELIREAVDEFVSGLGSFETDRGHMIFFFRERNEFHEQKFYNLAKEQGYNVNIWVL